MGSTLTFEPLPRRQGRGRWQLLGLLAVVIGPMLLASAMYRWQFWVPQTRSYHGELIATGQTPSDLGVAGSWGIEAGDEPRRWQLLVTSADDCGADCRALVYLARQIHIGLNREVGRAGHALAHGAALPADYDAELRAGYPQLQRLALDVERYPEPKAGAQLWIVDPHGNLVLRYGAGSNGKQILEDLRYLLKLSQIG
ncbi:hypothetical protein SAMN05216201_11692 [Pseudomonas linyingensis]|uniref:Cytochrome oxidase Cu insertion factor, SCO1/SenC/PrrC family n=1 Tax=Pseudomonas linyingensis TaxID=915471 RepID=A0A1H7BKF4_9PSED|nr:hypothetical protein [Pseudomonas linyingensis]SEJ75042.1 hypothetical protein SAMN05216201_11692 [Pseudomonas linyingensis]